MKNFNPQLWYAMGASLFFALLWSIPLKSLAKFVWLQEGGIITMVSYSTTTLVLFIILSGFISFVITKSIQYLKGEGDNINFAEFAFIFTCSMAFTTVFIFLGCPLLGFLVSGGVGSYITPYFLSYLYDEGEFKVPLTGDKKEIGSSVKSDKHVEGKNTTGGKAATGKSSTNEVVQGGGSSSNIGSDQESVKSQREVYTYVIETLKNIISGLENNNSQSEKITQIYKDVDFKLLLSEKALEAYNDDLSKHFLWVIIDKQCDHYKLFIDNRLGWVKTIISLKKAEVWPEVDRAYTDTLERHKTLLLEYEKKVKNVNFKKGTLISFKQFVDINNWFNKALTKEVNTLENVLMGKLREDAIYKEAEFRKIVNKDYIEVKKTFTDQDSYLRQKISDAYASQAAKKD